jgi:ribosomal protein S12 methylthiotransferase accessory factor
MVITIRPVKKQYFDGTHRYRSPEETYAAVEPLMAEIGVSEIIDVTPLDRLGIPVFSAVRPGAARGAVRVHAGKGKEPVHARVSAMMEALERYCAEYRGDRMEYATYEEIGPGRAVHPEDLIIPRELEQGEKLHWTPAWDILNDEEVYLPSNAVTAMKMPISFAMLPSSCSCSTLRMTASRSSPRRWGGTRTLSSSVILKYMVFHLSPHQVQCFLFSH